MSLTVSAHSYLYQAKPFRVDVVDQFVIQSASRVDGWISFYWGSTAAQLRAIDSPTIAEAITAGWLERFESMAAEMTKPSAQ